VLAEIHRTLHRAVSWALLLAALSCTVFGLLLQSTTVSLEALVLSTGVWAVAINAPIFYRVIQQLFAVRHEGYRVRLVA
jgi:hypothetical protein